MCIRDRVSARRLIPSRWTGSLCSGLLNHDGPGLYVKGDAVPIEAEPGSDIDAANVRAITTTPFPRPDAIAYGAKHCNGLGAAVIQPNLDE